MEQYYCEGEEDDKIAKEEIWSNFKTDHPTSNDKRPIFFALLGNNLFGRPLFVQLKALKKNGKNALFQKLRERSSKNRVQSEKAKSTGVEDQNISFSQDATAVDDIVEDKEVVDPSDEHRNSDLSDEDLFP